MVLAQRPLPWAFASSIRSATSTEPNSEPRRDILPSEQPPTSSSPIFQRPQRVLVLHVSRRAGCRRLFRAGHLCVNGASLNARDGRNANAALLVNVTPEDLPNDDPLAGIELQRACEAAAYRLGGSNWNAPAQLVGDFLAGRASKAPGKVKPTYPLGVTWTAIDEALPQHIVESLRLGLPLLGKSYEATTAPMLSLPAWRLARAHRSPSPETEHAMPCRPRASTLAVRELDMPAAS